MCGHGRSSTVGVQLLCQIRAYTAPFELYRRTGRKDAYSLVVVSGYDVAGFKFCKSLLDRTQDEILGSFYPELKFLYFNDHFTISNFLASSGKGIKITEIEYQVCQPVRRRGRAVKNEDNEEIHLPPSPLPLPAFSSPTHVRPSVFPRASRRPSERPSMPRDAGAVLFLLFALWAEVATSGAASQSHTLKAVKILRKVRPARHQTSSDRPTMGREPQ